MAETCTTRLILGDAFPSEIIRWSIERVITLPVYRRTLVGLVIGNNTITPIKTDAVVVIVPRPGTVAALILRGNVADVGIDIRNNYPLVLPLRGLPSVIINSSAAASVDVYEY